MGVDKTEEILYKAHEIGIYHEVIDLANKIGEQYPLMVVSDKLELAIKNKRRKRESIILNVFKKLLKPTQLSGFLFGGPVGPSFEFFNNFT